MGAENRPRAAHQHTQISTMRATRVHNYVSAPWSMYLLTTLLISCRSLSVISVFLGLSIAPITDMMS